MLRKSASLLLAAMLFLIMCACSVGEAKTKDTDSADTASAETETVNPTSSRLSVEDGLEKRDYDGEEFRIYVMSSHAEQFVVEKQDGEVVNDAVYASNLAGAGALQRTAHHRCFELGCLRSHRIDQKSYPRGRYDL